MSRNLCLALLLCQVSHFWSVSTRTGEGEQSDIELRSLGALHHHRPPPRPPPKHFAECEIKSYENPKHVAHRLLQEGRFEQARPCVELAAQRHPHNSELWSTLVFVETELGNMRSALAAKQHLHKLLPPASTKIYVEHLLELSELYLEILDEENSAKVLAEALEFAPSQIIFNTIYNRLVDIQARYNPQDYEPVRENVSWATASAQAASSVLLSGAVRAPFPPGPLHVTGANTSSPRGFILNSTAHVVYVQDKGLGIASWNGTQWNSKKIKLKLPSTPNDVAVAVVRDLVYLWTWHRKQTYMSLSSDLTTFSSPVLANFSVCNSSLTIVALEEALLALQTCSFSPALLSYSSYLAGIRTPLINTEPFLWTPLLPFTQPNVDCAVRRIPTISNASNWSPRSAFRVYHNPHLVLHHGLYFLFFSCPFVDVHPAVLRALFKEQNKTAGYDTIFYLVSNNVTGPFVSPSRSPNLPGVVEARSLAGKLGSNWGFVPTQSGLSVIIKVENELMWGQYYLEWDSLLNVSIVPRIIPFHAEL